MTERTRLWRWVDLLALTGLLVLLVGLPASGSDSADGEPYAQATTFEIPWPRGGDHIVYDVVVDDADGVRTYESVMEMTRRDVTPGEVPVVADFVEERTFRPIRVHDGNLVLESRGWRDATFYLATGERVYEIGSGTRPAFENNTYPWRATQWKHIEWQGQVDHENSETYNWKGFGGSVRHAPDERSIVTTLVEETFSPSDDILTSAEASYASRTIFGWGGFSVHPFERAVSTIFPEEYDDECAMSAGKGFQNFGWHPFVLYWESAETDCDRRTGWWLLPEHPGIAGVHEEIRSGSGASASLDLVPRILTRGEGDRYTPIISAPPANQGERFRPTRTADPPETTFALDIDTDARPMVRNLSLLNIRAELLATGPACVRDFLSNEGHIVSFTWRHTWPRTIPETIGQFPATLPRLPTGHEPNDQMTVYSSSWSLGLLNTDGEGRSISFKMKETYPGPTLEFTDWDAENGGPCTDIGETLDPKATVVPPSILAQRAAQFVIHQQELAVGDQDMALTSAAFAPAFTSTETGESKAFPGFAASGRVSLPAPIEWAVPRLDTDLGAFAFSRAYFDDQIWSENGDTDGAFSAHDGGVLRLIHRSEPAAASSASTGTESGSSPLVYHEPASLVRDTGFALLGTWLVVRIALAIRVGAHFPLVAWLYAKVRDADVLLHERRSAILAVLRHDPGMTASDVSKRLGLAWGATVHHLDRLSQAGLVRGVRDGRRRRFVVVEDGVGAKEALAASPERARVVAALAEEPGLSAAELATRLSRDRTSVARLAAQLVKLDLLERRRDGRKVRFYPKAADN